MTRIKSFYYFLIGKSLYRLGRYEEALIILEKANKFSASSGIDLYMTKTLNQINKPHKKDHKYKENNQLSQLAEDMQGQFQTLQKQIIKLNNNNKLKHAVTAFVKQEKNNKLIKEIEKLEERIEILEQNSPVKTPNKQCSQHFFSDEFTVMQNQVIQLQGKIEETDKIAEQDRSLLRENTKKLEEHSLILQNTNAIDKAEINEYIHYLKSHEPLLYIYYQTFYWTILNFFNAQSSLSTDLFAYNANYTATKKELRFNNVKTTMSNFNIITKHLPAIGDLSEFINDLVDKVYTDVQTRKFKNNTHIIDNIIKTKFHNPEKLELALSYSAFLIMNNRKKLTSQPELDLNNTSTTSNKDLLSKKNELVKLAFRDTVIIIAELYKNHESIINSDMTFQEHIKLILEDNKFKQTIKSINDNWLTPVDENIVKMIGNNISMEANIIE